MTTDKESFVVRTHDIHPDPEYFSWVQDIKKRFTNAQARISVKVNFEQLLFNWQLGRDIVVRKAEEKWGSGIVEQLSLDLCSEFPNTKGFSTTNLWAMKKWFEFYNPPCNRERLQQLAEEIKANRSHEKLLQLVGEFEETKNQVNESAFPKILGYIPWGHQIAIITKCKSIDEALFYIKCTIEEGWSRRTLYENMEAKLFNRMGNTSNNNRRQLPSPQGKLVMEITKESYDLGFISLSENYSENDLETELEQHMTRFLLELGNGWAFVGRQKEIIVAGKTRRIDLLFYHIDLRCYVVIELKSKEFEPEFTGKLNFYVNAVDKLIRSEKENPTIGLLICRNMNRTDVQWALQGISTPMGIATYNNIKIKEIQKRLPTLEQINTCIEKAETEYLDKRAKRKVTINGF